MPCLAERLIMKIYLIDMLYGKFGSMKGGDNMKVNLNPILKRIQEMDLETESEDILQLINVGEILIQYGLATEKGAQEFMYVANLLLDKLGEN